VSLCTQSEDKHVALLTDINGRTASEQVPRFEILWPRSSHDEKGDTCGHEVLDESDTHGLCILNGTAMEKASPGRLTSWQPNGESTIDYAMVSESLIPFVKEFHV
ncbi:hypothetical protein C8R43DRAFT_829926, partial [Mycena crocata]